MYQEPQNRSKGRVAFLAGTWSSLDPKERRRRAEAACRRGDAKALWGLLEAYLELRHGRHASRQTWRVYRRSVDLLLTQWPVETLFHPTPEDAAQFLGGLHGLGLRRSTLEVRRAGARAFFGALRWAGVVDRDPFVNVPLPKSSSEQGAAPTGYSASERERLLSLAGPADRTLLLLCTDAGLRVSECLQLRWSEVDLAGGRLLVQGGSVRPGRIVRLSGRLMHALSELSGAREDHVLGFRSDARARQRLQRLCRRAGVTYRGVDRLRLSGNLQGVPEVVQPREEGRSVPEHVAW